MYMEYEETINLFHYCILFHLCKSVQYLILNVIYKELFIIYYTPLQEVPDQLSIIEG